jgi:hypothetical protein
MGANHHRQPGVQRDYAKDKHRRCTLNQGGHAPAALANGHGVPLGMSRIRLQFPGADHSDRSVPADVLLRQEPDEEEDEEEDEGNGKGDDGDDDEENREGYSVRLPSVV